MRHPRQFGEVIGRVREFARPAHRESRVHVDATSVVKSAPGTLENPTRELISNRHYLPIRNGIKSFPLFADTRSNRQWILTLTIWNRFSAASPGTRPIADPVLESSPL